MLIFPGFDGEDYHIDSLKTEVEIYNKENKIKRNYIICDWNLYNNKLLVAKSGEIMGKEYATKIEKIFGNQILNIHVIGISAGSFAADYFCKEIKKLKQEHYLHLTLLDPFLLKGLNPFYGIKNFGIDSNYCEQYLNSNDPVPFTNKPILNGFVNDVTFCQQKKDFMLIKKSIENDHSWPIYYYVKNWNITDPIRNKMSHLINKRGTVRYLK